MKSGEVDVAGKLGGRSHVRNGAIGYWNCPNAWPGDAPMMARGAAAHPPETSSSCAAPAKSALRWTTPRLSHLKQGSCIRRDALAATSPTAAGNHARTPIICSSVLLFLAARWCTYPGVLGGDHAALGREDESTFSCQARYTTDSFLIAVLLDVAPDGPAR